VTIVYLLHKKRSYVDSVKVIVATRLAEATFNEGLLRVYLETCILERFKYDINNPGRDYQVVAKCKDTVSVIAGISTGKENSIEDKRLKLKGITVTHG